MQMAAEAAWPVRLLDDYPDDEERAAVVDRLVSAVRGDGVTLPGVVETPLYVYLRWGLGDVDPAGAPAAAARVAAGAWRAATGAGVAPVQVSTYPADTGLVPAALDLVGVGQVGEMLGVSRQRASQLAARLPVVGYPSGAPVFVRRAVELVTAGWNRSPGRPSRG